MGLFGFGDGKPTEPTGCPDVPVADIKDDRFNVGQYISGLSISILSCDTPMTISIQGDWGSGKTSMMNMIDANIRSRNRNLVQSVNELLSDLPTQFSVYQSRRRNDGIISSYDAGYAMINKDGKEYKLQYDVDNLDQSGLRLDKPSGLYLCQQKKPSAIL